MDWNDQRFSLGKRKAAYVKWLMSAPRKVPGIKARAMANAKFGGGTGPVMTARALADWRAADAEAQELQMRGG